MIVLVSIVIIIVTQLYKIFSMSRCVVKYSFKSFQFNMKATSKGGNYINKILDYSTTLGYYVRLLYYFRNFRLILAETTVTSFVNPYLRSTSICFFT